MRRGFIHPLVLVVAAAAAAFAAGRLSAEVPLRPVTPLVAASETIMGEPIVYPDGRPAKITAAVVALEPGGETGWHTHGVPTFGYVLEGELTVDYGEKGSRIYRAGDAVLEAIAIPHNGRNTGAGPMRILAVFMGADGLRTSVPYSER
jgi:quercetin dioxygenase-like cupin family protein